MLSIFNNLFDFNILNYSPYVVGFVGLGISLLSFSSYYFINSAYQNSIINSISNPSQNNISYFIDKGIQTDSINLVGKGLQTETINHKDQGIETDDELLEKIIFDYILDNLSVTSSSRLTQDFLIKYKNNPKYAEFFRTEEIQNWSNNVENISPTSTSSTSSEINFLLKVKEMLKSTNSSNSDVSINSDISTILSPSNNIEQLKILKNIEIKDIYSKEIDINMLSDEDVNYIVNSFTIEDLTDGNINSLILEIINVFNG